MQSQVYGWTRRAQHLGHPWRPPLDEADLAHRVETAVFRDRSVPKGRINVSVECGAVVLRGELEQPEDIRTVEAAVRRVPGVSEVRNLLHLPGTPAPNKREALRVH